VVNIVEKQGRDVVRAACDPSRLKDPAEHLLHTALLEAQAKVNGAVKADDYPSALKEITGLKPAVDTFFDKVMVMVEDPALRENRVRLLTEIGALFAQVADFSKIQAESA
jgi:glycyl-tRNA synthetase beta chain